MSLYGILRTGVSGMNAQSNKLSTIADNIANAGTTGYKRAWTDFSSLILESGKNNYNSGAVVTNVRYSVSQQGALDYTTSPTDLAIQGRGFFAVTDATGNPFLSRAGAFVIDGNTGNLVNSSGYTLMGYDISNGPKSVELNGFGNLEPINLSNMNLQAKASTEGVFTANLPSTNDVVTGPLPSSNNANAEYSVKSSMIAYDKLGNEVTLDLYMTKTSESPATWEMAVYDQAGAAADGGFPYADAAIGTQTLEFDDNGNLTSGDLLSIDIPGGETLALDVSSMTQLATDYTPINVAVNGSAPSVVSDIAIEGDGTVYAVYENGAKLPAFRIPLADVSSPDSLQPMPGNVFATTTDSGDVQMGFPTEGGYGGVVSGALEQSNVDMASELTDMIIAQRDYTANSKSFQTGNELLDVLMNLKR
jgi:flagellar hook protein FlgE